MSRTRTAIAQQDEDGEVQRLDDTIHETEAISKLVGLQFPSVVHECRYTENGQTPDEKVARQAKRGAPLLSNRGGHIDAIPNNHRRRDAVALDLGTPQYAFGW